MTFSSFADIDLTANLAFTWPAAFGAGFVIQDRMNITPDQDGWIMTLPPANQGGAVSDGYVFANKGAFNFIVQDNAANTLVTIASGEVYLISLVDATTQSGVWDADAFMAGETSITRIEVESSDSSVVITGSPAVAPTGTIDITLQPALNSLQAVDALGFPALVNTDPMTYTARTFVAGNTGNLVIENPAGTDDNVSIDLNTDITGLSSLVVGSVQISGSTIETTGGNTDITFRSGGTGSVLDLNTAIIDQSGNISANNINLTGSFVSPYVSKATIAFKDTVTDTNHVISPIFGGTDTNLIPTFSSQGYYQCSFVTTRPDTNYTAIVQAACTDGSQPLILHGRFVDSSKTTGGFLIAVTDASGELVASVPNGVTVTVFAAT